MLRYWSTWNFMCWLHHELHHRKFENPLKMSIIISSIIGGSFIYLYPRKFTLRILNHKYKLPYAQLLLGDLIIHQLPMYRMLRQNYTSTICGRYLLPATIINILISNLRKINKDEIYDVKFRTVTILSYGSFTVASLIAHKKTLQKTLQTIQTIPKLLIK